MCDKRNSFCYVCGLFVDKQHRRELKANNIIIEAYNLNFEPKYSENRWYQPEYICSTCFISLKKWKFSQCSQNRLPFSSPMIWHHQVIHKPEDCYFCQTDLTGQRFKTRHSIHYPDVLTATKPCPREKEKEQAVVKTAEEDDKIPSDGQDDDDESFIPAGSATTERHLVSNSDMNDIIRDLSLSWRQAEILSSRLKQWNLVEKDLKITSMRKNAERIIFNENFEVDSDDKDLVYCNDVDKLFQCFDKQHQSKNWRLFIDGSCKSLKAVLLHNENELPSVPLAYATNMKETYETLAKILRVINYPKHQWEIVSDLKVLTILFGMQGGYTKYPCYFCEWNSRAKNHYDEREWPLRKIFEIGKSNVVKIPLVAADKIILPPLHLKLGYMKQFVKRLDKDSEAFLHLKATFPKLSDAKIKEGVFVGPQIRKIMNDENFTEKLNPVERRAWKGFISLCNNFLGNKRSDDYVAIVNEFLQAYGDMGCRMSIKIHFLHSHLDFFPENLGKFSDEQGERFHQEMTSIEQRFHGKNKQQMLADYCWSLERETNDSSLKRRRSSKHF